MENILQDFIDGKCDISFQHLLDYAETDEYKIAAKAQFELEQLEQRETGRKGSRLYRERHPEFASMRQQAAKHKPELYAKQNGRCAWCGKPLEEDYETDHIKPLTRGGSNRIKNLCVVHPGCNKEKGVGSAHS